MILSNVILNDLKFYKTFGEIIFCLRSLSPGRSNKLIINIKPATLPPEISINFAAASAVPPVAIKSSIINIFSFFFMSPYELLW